MDNPTLDTVKEIHTQLQNDPRTKGAQIDVSFNQSMVTLTGIVKSLEVRQAAEEIARQQPGVLSVVNELRVG